MAWEENRYFDLRRWQKAEGDLSETCKWLTAMVITKNADGTVSEEAFEMRIKEMNSWNDRIREKISKGIKYKVVRIDDKYFENLLNFK